jgi:hypothetical protein
MSKIFFLPLLAAVLAAGSAWWSGAPDGLHRADPPTASVRAAQSGGGDGGAGGAGPGTGEDPGSGPTTQGGVIGDPDG